MIDKIYRVALDGKEIGTTQLEHADVPMGIVFGRLHLYSIDTPYLFFKEYCLQHGVQSGVDDMDMNLISTYDIPGMEVVSPEGVLIKGLSTYVEGTNDEMQVHVIGIPAAMYEAAFPHHVNIYRG